MPTCMNPWYHLADLARYHGQYCRLMAHGYKVIAAPFARVRAVGVHIPARV